VGGEGEGPPGLAERPRMTPKPHGYMCHMAAGTQAAGVSADLEWEPGLARPPVSCVSTEG
jgi:hypothetical protein